MMIIAKVLAIGLVSMCIAAVAFRAVMALLGMPGPLNEGCITMGAACSLFAGCAAAFGAIIAGENKSP